MKRQVHLPRSQRVPFIPFANPFEFFSEFEEDNEGINIDELLDLLEQAADDPNIEVGASPELAMQINEWVGFEPAQTEKELT